MEVVMVLSHTRGLAERVLVDSGALMDSRARRVQVNQHLMLRKAAPRRLADLVRHQEEVVLHLQLFLSLDSVVPGCPVAFDLLRLVELVAITELDVLQTDLLHLAAFEYDLARE